MTEALAAFASVGARRACELAQDALELAREQVAMFEAAPEDPSPEERRELFAVLRDLDLSLLESAILPNLLALDRKPADAAASIPAVEELHDRLCHQFLAWEAAAVVPLGERPVHPTIRLRRLRALIHLLDVDAEEGPDVGLRARVSRDRWLRASHTVLRRLVSDPPSVFRRSLAAALARALEGLVRAEVCDPVDALLFVAQHLAAPEHFTTLSEASKHPNLIALMRPYEAFVRRALAAKEPPHGAEVDPFECPPVAGFPLRWASGVSLTRAKWRGSSSPSPRSHESCRATALTVKPRCAWSSNASPRRSRRLAARPRSPISPRKVVVGRAPSRCSTKR